MSCKTAIDRDRLWKHGFLVLLLCLLAANIALTIHRIRINDKGFKFGSIFLAVLIILNHIEIHYTKQGPAAMVMKVLARGWLIPTSAYLAWEFLSIRG